MFERATYFKGKFIRNGIAGFVFSALFIYLFFTKKDESMNPIIFAFPIAAFAWLFYGFRISKKLKEKNKTSVNDPLIISDERISYKQADFIFSIFVLVSLLLSFNHWKYANYLILLGLVAYTWWFSRQMKLLEEYFKN